MHLDIAVSAGIEAIMSGDCQNEGFNQENQ